MTSRRIPVLDHAATLADVNRCRLLALLGRHELMVSELCAVVQLPQSTVSRHLKVLGDDGWVRSRREGTSHLYELPLAELAPVARQLWHLVRAELETTSVCAADGRRLDGVLAARRTRSQEFFATTAGEWDRLRDELFGERFDLMALAGLLDPGLVVGDLACGTGRVAALLAPFVARVVAIDSSRPMLQAARQRLAGVASVEVRDGTLEQLPIGDGELDRAMLFLALHHLPDPSRALAEARRVLKPAGGLLVVDMMAHDRVDLQQKMGHVWLGFAQAQMHRFLAGAGFGGIRFAPLAMDSAAKGPALFAATATVATTARTATTAASSNNTTSHTKPVNPRAPARP